MNTADLHWLAGLIEGEGYIGQEKTGFRLQVDMTDADVVERAWRLSGVGTFIRKHTPRDQATGRQPIYRWSVRRKSDVIPLLEALHPLMGDRRAQRIEEILKAHVEGPSMA